MLCMLDRPLNAVSSRNTVQCNGRRDRFSDDRRNCFVRATRSTTVAATAALIGRTDVMNINSLRTISPRRGCI